jgi:TonB family protein
MKRSPHISVAAEFSDAAHLPERRTQLRHQPRSLVYVELDEGNGGIVLNISEDGMTVQAVMGLMDDFLSRVRFQLSESKEWIETSAQVAWANETRKLLGLRFVELPEQSRRQIRQWVERERSGNQDAGSPEIPAEAPAKPQEAPAALPAVPAEPLPVAAVVVETMPVASIEPPPPEEPAEAVSVIAADSHPDLHLSEIPALSSEFTPHVASLTTVTETAEIEPSVITSVDVVSEPSTEQKAEPVPFFQRESFRAPVTSDSLPDKWSAAVFFLFLATASLAAGWAVGRCALSSGLQTFRRVVLREGAAGAVASPSAALTPRGYLSEIEIINANNDRWTIPLASSALVTGVQTRPGSDGISPSPNRGTKVPFRTWVLTAPVQPRNTGDNSDSVAPPVASAVEGAQNAIPLVEQPYSIPAPPPPKQAVVRAPQLIRRVDPVYPPLAVSRHLDGIVKMHLIVGANGAVRDVRVLSGPPMLAEAAARAAGQWVYSPAIVDGKPSDSDVDISIAFHLP